MMKEEVGDGSVGGKEGDRHQDFTLVAVEMVKTCACFEVGIVVSELV